MGVISASIFQMIKDVPVHCLTESRKLVILLRKGEFQLCNTLEKTIMDY